MTTRMLIDARHPEETRVAVLKGNRIDEFDFESADHKQIKGNIYLAKVTRVEPSLQAAFIDFGGNRHGFLAFSEIHPDYYQIPKEDREALLAEEAAHAEEEAALRAAEDDHDDGHDDGHEDDGHGDDGHGDDDDHYGDDLTADYADASGVTEIDTSEKDEVATLEGGQVESEFGEDAPDSDVGDENQGEDGPNDEDGQNDESRPRGRRRQGGRAQAKEADELRAKRMALRRRYKIQDVIQRRQVLLVQVVKEERGNKGAALTTYLSLAGRYCVLMPNSSHGGGISRKISSSADRKRLKSIISEMALPKSMGCIVRTAGLSRTKPEIKRDFDYLARLWDEIRERTLKSSAPAEIHSDSDLIKRAIRDIYNREIEDVIVEGEGGYKAARDFMKLLMPSHARRVKAYADPVPLFQRYGAEDQLTAMYDPVVQLKSGGYLVINPTEALVSIDVNSGRSTKEHGIEATALNTNLEAAREVARQLRLRDMAGLVVIDFIDMEYSGSNRKVEKAMKDALKNDRARIQIGRISSFGLMEMSRQRLRTGVLEATTRGCPHCDGTGLVRTAGSAGLSALRMIEDEAAKGKGSVITLYASQEATIYVLNAKRADLAEIEERYGVRVEVIPEGENEGAKMRVGSSGPRPEFVPRFEPIVIEEDDDDLPPEDFDDEEEAEDEEQPRQRERNDGEREGGEREAGRDGGRDGGRGKRRRRGGRGRDRAEGDAAPERAERPEGAQAEAGDEDGDDAGQPHEASQPHGERGEGDLGADGEGPRRRRRRGRRRRGGRGRDGAEGSENPQGEGVGEGGDEAVDGAVQAASDGAEPQGEAEPMPADNADVAPVKKRVRRKPGAADPAAASAKAASKTAEAAPVADAVAAHAAGEDTSTGDAAAEPAKPKRTRARKAPAEAAAQAPAEAVAQAEPEAEAEAAPAKPKRSRSKKQDETPAETAPAAELAEAGDAAETNADGSPRRGWWQRTFGA